MLRHFFKLIWNKKKANSLLMVEIWASFLVLFGVGSLIIYTIRNYIEPIGFEYENVWALTADQMNDTTEIVGKGQQAIARIRSYPEVLSVSNMSSNFPYSNSMMNNAYEYNKRKVQASTLITDENFGETLDIEMLEGKWFTAADSVGKYKPVVINHKMKEELFENESAVGKVISDKYKVTGVTGYFKEKGEFDKNKPILFEQVSGKFWNSVILMKVKPGTDAHFEAKLVKDVTSMLKDWTLEVDYLTDSRQNQHRITLVPVVIFLVVSLFLLVNVAFGLFGVLNLNIAKRKNEIGLRRALGATERNIALHFIAEMWVIATFSIVVGLLFAVQFPLLDVFGLPSGVYFLAILASIGIIYGIVTLCAWYPSAQASRINPATALHEE